MEDKTMTKFNDVYQYFVMMESDELLSEFMRVVYIRICSSMESLYCSASITAVRMNNGTVITYRKTDKADKYGSPIYKTTFTDKTGRERPYFFYELYHLLEFDSTLEYIIDYEDYSHECIVESEIK